MKREADAGYVQAFYVQYPIVVPCCSTLNRVAIEASVHAFANICHFIIWQSGRWGQGCTFLTERFFLADATSNWSIHLNKGGFHLYDVSVPIVTKNCTGNIQKCYNGYIEI